MRKYETLTHYRETGEAISSQESLGEYLDDLEQFARKNQRTRIVVFLSTPEMPNIYPEVLCSKEWFRNTISNDCSVSVLRSEIVDRLSRLDKKISERLSSLANVAVFDPTPALCPTTSKVCTSNDGVRRLYSDEDHLTRDGSLRVKAEFMKFLKENEVF
jgi:hypothetical protein